MHALLHAYLAGRRQWARARLDCLVLMTTSLQLELFAELMCDEIPRDETPRDRRHRVRRALALEACVSSIDVWFETDAGESSLVCVELFGPLIRADDDRTA
jgi:hypothetical protein